MIADAEFIHGTQRIVVPSETLRRIEPLMKPIGVTRIANITGLDRVGIPVFLTCRPNSRSLAVSQGKGSSQTAARVSAMMESLETYHAERVVNGSLFARYDDLHASHDALWTQELQPVSYCTYSNQQPTSWILGSDLVSARPVYVPLEAVHVDMTVPLPALNGFMRTSNGLASGNSDLEAMAHGLWEAVERDCTTLWDLRPLNERNATKVRPETVDDAVCRDLIDRFENAEIDVAIWDVSNDLKVPCFAAMIRDAKPASAYRTVLAGGFGCHPNRGIALARALTEAAQSRLTSISGARDDVTRSAYEATETNAYASVAELMFAPGGVRAFGDTVDFAMPTIQGAFDETLRRLAACGIHRVVGVNLTRDDIGVSVWKVVVPGLERPKLRGYLPGPRARRER